MLRRDKVDVVAAGRLQTQHRRRQLAGVQFPPLGKLTDLEILAENAAQVAAAEENRSRPIPAAQAIFFAEVRKGARNPCPPAVLADAGFVFPAVDLSFPRAHFAGTQQFLRGHDSFCELPQFVGFEVSGNKIAPRAQEATATVQRLQKVSAPLG